MQLLLLVSSTFKCAVINNYCLRKPTDKKTVSITFVEAPADKKTNSLTLAGAPQEQKETF